MPEVDIAIVGAGAAGLSVAAAAAQLGRRTVLIERARMGGECLNTGCVPSKALLAIAAETVAAGRHGGRRPDWASLQDRVRAAITAIAPNDSVERFEGLNAKVLAGQARFVAPDTLAVRTSAGEHHLQARRIILAAGSRPAIPSIPGLADIPYITHETLFELPNPPKHLLILGGGAIGLEMAQAHARLGCEVTLVEKHRLGSRDDPDLVAVIEAALRADGVRIVTDATVISVEPGPTLVLQDGRRLSGGTLLVAAGRRANIEDLDLMAGHVRASAAGIATDPGLRSLTNKRVFAAGDIADPVGIGPVHLTHSASHHAGIVIRRALFRLPARVRAHLPRAIYTDPELAQAGLTEAEARAAGHAVHVLSWPLTENDRAQAERRTEGLVKLVVGRGGRILGAGIAAPHAGEMISAWTLAIQRRIGLAAMADLVVPYPTFAEAGRRAAGSAFTARLFSPSSRALVGWLSRLP